MKRGYSLSSNYFRRSLEGFTFLVSFFSLKRQRRVTRKFEFAANAEFCFWAYIHFSQRCIMRKPEPLAQGINFEIFVLLDGKVGRMPVPCSFALQFFMGDAKVLNACVTTKD